MKTYDDLLQEMLTLAKECNLDVKLEGRYIEFVEKNTGILVDRLVIQDENDINNKLTFSDSEFRNRTWKLSSYHRRQKVKFKQ